MFGLFKSAEEKICDQVGESIHRQIYAITSAGQTVFNAPEEMVFFSGYLEMLISSFAEYSGSGGIWANSEKHRKYVCDGVIPSAGWTIYQKGKGMVELSEAANFDVKAVYDLGQKAGWADAFDGITVSNRLYQYLIGEDLDLGFDE